LHLIEANNLKTLLKGKKQMDNGMDLEDRVTFVNSRWIETNRTLSISDLVNHCRAELELKQQHLAEAEQFAEQLGADASLSDHYREQCGDLWEMVGRNHKDWIAGHPDATIQELLAYLLTAQEQCEDVYDMSIEEALDEMGGELYLWYGHFPQDGDLTELTNYFYDNIEEDIEDVQSLSLIVTKDFKVSDLPKPQPSFEEIRQQAMAAIEAEAQEAVLA
jgi:hypothetical protein